jgi:hypothetical protein
VSVKMKYTHKPYQVTRKPRIPHYMRKPSFDCTKKLPIELLFDGSLIPAGPLLNFIHQVQNELYNCSQIIDDGCPEDEKDAHYIHRAFEYARHRKFCFDIIANAEGFALEFYHKELPGKIVVPMGVFNDQGLDPEFIRTYAEHVFKIVEIMKLKKKERAEKKREYGPYGRPIKKVVQEGNSW